MDLASVKYFLPIFIEVSSEIFILGFTNIVASNAILLQLQGSPEFVESRPGQTS